MSTLSRRQFIERAAMGAAMAALPDWGAHAAGGRRPNVLFCIADDASFPHMGAYGCPWVNTPAFDRVAREGILFNRAYTPNAKCSPSRACLLTGRNSWQLAEAANHWPFFPPRFRAFTEALAADGYEVGAFGKAWGPGTSLTEAGAPREMVAPRTPIRRFLQQRSKERPFFFWFGSQNPHRPYKLGSGLEAGKKLSDIDRVPAYWPDNDTVRGDMLDYALEVEAFDREVGTQLQALEEAGELENTLVVITSDNGMPFPRSKGQCYDIAVHMPMAMMWPAGIRKPGRKVDDLVSFVDFAPTFLELAGVSQSQSGMQPMAGRSLAPILSGTGSRREPLLIGRERNDWGRPGLAGYPVRGIVDERYMFLMNLKPDRWPACNPEADFPDVDASPTKTLCVEARGVPAQQKYFDLCFGKRGAEELYDLRADPDCVRNLAGDRSHAPAKERLRKHLMEQLRAQQDPRIVGDGDVFDRYPSAKTDWADAWERLVEKK